MANARTGKTSTSNNGVAAALKEEMHRALSHMPGYGEHFSDADVGIDVTNEGSDFAVYLFAREPQGLSGTSMIDAPQQWHDEMNARENAVNAIRDVLMSNSNINDAEFDDSDEFYGSKGDFVAALNAFFDAKGLPRIINPLLVTQKDKAAKRKPAKRDTALLDGIKERIIDGYDDMHGLYEFQNDVTNQPQHNADERVQATRARAEQVMEIGLTDAEGERATLSLDYDGNKLSGPNEASLISNLNGYAEALANKVTELDPAAKPETTRRDYLFYKEEEHGGEVTYLEDESGHHGLELSGRTTITAPRAVLLQAIDALAPETPNRAGGSYAIG